MTSTKSTNKNISVYGILPSRAQAEQVVERLKLHSFRAADISVLFPVPSTSKEFAHVNSTKAPEGAALGGTSGAVIGGALGWLAGLGAIAIPGVGPFVAAGPIMALIAGAGAGSVVGGVAGALIGMGMPEYEAKRFEGRIKDGGILISVHCDNEEWRDSAKEILEEYGAEDISSSSESTATTKDSGRPAVANY